MRLLVVAALAAALALAESAALDKKAVVGEELLAELEQMAAAKVKEKEAMSSHGGPSQDKRQEDSGLPDMDVVFEDGRDRVFTGVLLNPQEGVGVVGYAMENNGTIAPGFNIYDMDAFFLEGNDDWMLGYYMTTEWAIGLVAGLHQEWPPLCVWDKSGCDISGFTKTLADKDDIAVSGYGLAIPDAIQLVGAHLDHETGQIDDVAALGADIAAAGSYHAGRMVGYEDAVAGVSAALGLEEKKSLPASKKNVEVAELLQKLREYVRDLNQK
ncbi:uncharacterized protein LOC144879365 [Branchiostoma floridae x Branchiostoma japonicum]